MSFRTTFAPAAPATTSTKYSVNFWTVSFILRVTCRTTFAPTAPATTSTVYTVNFKILPLTEFYFQGDLSNYLRSNSPSNYIVRSSDGSNIFTDVKISHLGIWKIGWREKVNKKCWEKITSSSEKEKQEFLSKKWKTFLSGRNYRRV